MNIFFTVLAIMAMSMWIVCVYLVIKGICDICYKICWDDKLTWYKKSGDVLMWLVIMFILRDITKMLFECSGL